MPQSDQYNDQDEVSYLANLPGADVENGWLVVRVENEELDISDDPDREMGLVTIKGSIPIENANGDKINPATQETLSLLAGALSNNGDDSILVDSNTPLDVSAANVTVDQSGTVTIQEETPIDVGGSDVTVSALEEALVSNDTDVLKVQHDGVIDVSSRDGRNLGSIDIEAVNDTIKTEDSDRNSIQSETVSSNGSVTKSLSAEGASNLKGRVKSDSQYTVELSWKDSSGNEQFRDEVAANVTGGETTQINQGAISPDVDVIVNDASGSESVVTGLLNMV